MMELLDGVKADAVLSPDGVYRYALTRDWFPKERGHVLWIMLNPSVADAEQDDPTLRRCQHFARAWGYDGITVVNLFALRSPTPDVLKTHPDPVGDANDDVIESYLDAQGIGLVMAAWGAHGQMRYRDQRVITMAHKAARGLHALGFTKAGAPKHPLARGRERVTDDAMPKCYR